MKSTPNQKELEKTLTTLIQKCWEDESFKKELMANPVSTLETVKGGKINLPEGVQLVVNDHSDPSFIHFNIPAKSTSLDMELSDAELEAVAGGVDGLLQINPPSFWDIAKKLIFG